MRQRKKHDFLCVPPFRYDWTKEKCKSKSIRELEECLLLHAECN